MTKETIQPESETQKTIIKPFSLKSRYANEKNYHKTFLCSSKICETKKTFKNLSLFNQGMRKEENLHIASLISSEVCEKKFGRIFATVRESPPYLSIRSQPPTLHHIYRITKQKLQTRS